MKLELFKMKPVDVTFTFAAQLNPALHERSRGSGDSKHSYAGFNMLDSFCQTLTNKFVVKKSKCQSVLLYHGNGFGLRSYFCRNMCAKNHR